MLLLAVMLPLLPFAHGEPPPMSPCPPVFSIDSYADKFWTTTLQVHPNRDRAQLLISLHKPAHVQSDCACQLTTRDNVSFSLNLNSGQRPLVVKLLVKYQNSQAKPEITSIMLDGLQVCPVETVRTRRDKTQWVTPDFNLYGTTRRTTTTAEEWLTPNFGPLVTSKPSKRPNTPTQSTVPKVTVPEVTVRVPPKEPVSCGVPVMRTALPLIISGQTTERGQWPWHAALYLAEGTEKTDGYICGATLVTRRSLVTAAHCVTPLGKAEPHDPAAMKVYLGMYELSQLPETGVQIKKVSRIFVHPSYNASSYYADIAVLVLLDHVEYTSFVLPVCMWDASLTDLSHVLHQLGSIVGWGIDKSGQPTRNLELAAVPVVAQHTCRKSAEVFLHFTSELTYCAGFKNGTSPCNGDSGGGMVFSTPLPNGSSRWSLRGVVSLSTPIKNRNTCDSKQYTVFTDVAKCLGFVTDSIVD